jgi:predicted metal-binding membrane protein
MAKLPIAHPPTPFGVTPLERARRRAPVRWPFAVVALAWGLVLLAMATGLRYLVDHHWLLEESGMSFLVALAVFVACWQVMTASMMLPSSLPAMVMMTLAARRQRRGHVALVLFVAGFAAVWTAFAVAAFTGDSFIHRAVDRWPWLAAHSFLIGAATLTLAGLFHLTPLRARYLGACRRHVGLFVHHYSAGTGTAWWLGLRYGGYSLGCCWALMLVMFGLGVGGLLWMAALAGVMWLEQVATDGKGVTTCVAIALLLLAVVWVVHPTVAGAV